MKILVVSFGRSGYSSDIIGTLDLLDRDALDADRLNIACNAEGQMATRKASGPGEQRLSLLPPQTKDQALAMTGFRHGPKPVVDPRTRAHVLILSDAHTRRYDLDAASEIRAQLQPETVLTLGPDRDNVVLHVPQIGNDAWSAVLYVVAAQIQATVWSQMLGLDVDNPFQCGTVRRVVEGATLYPLEGE